MEQLQDASHQQSRLRLIVIISVIASLFVASAAFGFLRAEQLAAQRHAHYVAALNQLAALKSTGTTVLIAQHKLKSAQVAFFADYEKALNASQKRHDNAVSDSPDTDYMYEQAKIEVAGVESLGDDADNIEAAYEGLANAFAHRYGDDTVSKLRSDFRSANEAIEDADSNWDRAAGDIKDSLQQREEGQWSYSSSGTGGLYEASSEAENRAQRHWTDATSDIEVLQKRLDTDTSKAQSAMNALPK